MRLSSAAKVSRHKTAAGGWFSLSTTPGVGLSFQVYLIFLLCFVLLHACGKRSQSALLLISSRTTRLSSQQGAENESGKTTITIRSFTAEAAAAAAAREQQLCCAVYCISFHVSCCHSNIDAHPPAHTDLHRISASLTRGYDTLRTTNRCRPLLVQQPQPQ